MSIRNLDSLFKPRSIAVFGASNRPGSIGAVLIRNLIAGGFAGPVLPVNPNAEAIAGVLAYRDTASLPFAPDLAVICTPPGTVPGLIADLAARGSRAAVVITAGLARLKDENGTTCQARMLEAARPSTFRILGPNCVGLLVPGLGLNASFAHTGALPGKIAFVSQSGALCTEVLDWAKSRKIGFSHFVSLGDSADVDFGDTIDYLASDPETRAILLYIEAVTAARKFMSAARAAARNKPVLVIKAGRVAEGARAAASHTGALAGADDVYDAAFRRAGMLRVHDTDTLFSMVEALARVPRFGGDRLAIVTNGGGPGVLATDDLVIGGGRLATLSAPSMAALDAVLPATWSRGNPIDIIGDAQPDRYVAALDVVLADPEVDAVLAMYAPTAIAPPTEIARRIVPSLKASKKAVLTSWLGTDWVAPARRLFEEAGIASFESPHKAVGAFLHMTEYWRNQEALLETPAGTGIANPDRALAAAIVQRALAEGRRQLNEPEAKAVLAAYGVPVVETRIVGDAASARTVAMAMGFPVALKILSPDISHKSDVGGVALDLGSADEVVAAAEAMQSRVASLRPDARLAGFTVQRMARRPRAHELIVGAATDRLFGPVILFGQGGTAVEVVADKAVGLPPLNDVLARQLVDRTRVARLLRGYRDRPAADLPAIGHTLVAVSQLVCDLAEIVELDINPLLADDHGVVALDARITLAPAAKPGDSRLAIKPYPRELEETRTLTDGQAVVLRPIRPEDEPAHQAFFSRLDPADVRFRFFGMVRSLDHTQMARLTQIDYDREMAFVAMPAGKLLAGGETWGVVRVVADPDNYRAEFALIVRSDLTGKGLGYALLDKMVRYCRGRAMHEIVGIVLADNPRMLALAEALGFTRRRIGGDEFEVRLGLADAG
ncbi:MAG: bifunctional acetate--CoA ligase family protein/GNAT family N-acetyltransferase [Alphaproteobacteria bacterium]